MTAVGSGDGGAHSDPVTGKLVSAGLPATPENCARSIDARRTANEWLVRNYRTVGIFAFLHVTSPACEWLAFPNELYRAR